MTEADSQLMRLQDLQQFLASATLEDSLQRHAQQAARLLGADTCSIMLLNSGTGQDLRMSVCASHGGLPDAALHGSTGKGEGISGQVLASGRSLLVADLASSEYAGLARHPDAPRGSLMSSPIRIDGRIAGVVNAARHGGAAPFGPADLHLLDVTTLFIGKSVQVIQLQRLLDSRFAQMALLREAQDKVGHSVRSAYRNPEDVARILARSFFKEMTQAGFVPGQIVSAATELIEQLNRTMERSGPAAGA